MLRDMEFVYSFIVCPFMNKQWKGENIPLENQIIQ